MEEGEDEGTLLGIALHVSQIVGQTSFAGFRDSSLLDLFDLHVIRICFAVAFVFNHSQSFTSNSAFPELSFFL